MSVRDAASDKINARQFFDELIAFLIVKVGLFDWTKLTAEKRKKEHKNKYSVFETQKDESDDDEKEKHRNRSFAYSVFDSRSS